jgi:hypothetical protein
MTFWKVSKSASDSFAQIAPGVSRGGGTGLIFGSHLLEHTQALRRGKRSEFLENLIG